MSTNPIIPAPSPGAFPSSGELSKISPIRLYCAAARTEQTGILRFKLSDRLISVVLGKGVPESVTSSHPDDALTLFLVKQKLATSEQLGKAKEASEKFGGDLLATLFSLGILNPQTAMTPLAQRAAHLLSRAFAASSGSFAYQPESKPNRIAIPLGDRWSLMVDATRRLSSADVRRRLHGVLDLAILKSRVREAGTELKLTPQEARAANRLSETRTLNQILRSSPQESDGILHVALLLREFGALQFDKSGTFNRPISQSTIKAPALEKPSSPPPQGAGGPAAKVNTAPPAEMSLDDLRHRVQQLKGQSLFEVLGLSDKADSGAIKAAYFKWARVFHPDTVPPNAPPEVAKLKSDLFAALGEAYRTLGDEKSRAAYRDELKSGGAKEVDIAQIFAAEQLFNKACLLVKAKRFADALRTLEDAIKANPDEGEFYAWRGYAKYLVLKDEPNGKAEAQKDIQLALSKNQWCAPAHYFLGQISRLSGDNEGAAKHFKRALELKPDYLDAQRELRFVTAK